MSVTLDTTHSDGDGVGADVDTSSESYLQRAWDKIDGLQVCGY